MSSNRLLFPSDNLELWYSTLEVFKYLLLDEAKDFCSNGCKNSHIFVDLVLSVKAFEANCGTELNEVYVLSKELIDKFEEDKADRLISISESINKMDVTELDEMFY